MQARAVRRCSSLRCALQHRMNAGALAGTDAAMQLGSVVLALGVVGCGAAPARLDPPPARGLAIQTVARLSSLRVERLELVIDGERQAGTSVQFDRLPDGPHTVELGLHASIACGLLDAERGLLTVRDARGFFLRSPGARLQVSVYERPPTHAWTERLAVAWPLLGYGIETLPGCSFGPAVALHGCSPDLNAVPERR